MIKEILYSLSIILFAKFRALCLRTVSILGHVTYLVDIFGLLIELYRWKCIIPIRSIYTRNWVLVIQSESN